MKIEALTDDSIIVELSGDDMKNLNITYEEMDYSNIETKRVIWTILSRARRTLGRELDTSGKLFVEAMRRDSGGCVLFFSVEQQEKPRRYLVKPQAEYITCEFDCAENLILCAQRLAGSRIRCDSRLYSLGGRYRLLVRPKSGINLLKACLPEYGTVVGDTAVLTAAAEERWRCITRENAIERITCQKASS